MQRGADLGPGAEESPGVEHAAVAEHYFEHFARCCAVAHGAAHVAAGLRALADGEAVADHAQEARLVVHDAARVHVAVAEAHPQAGELRIDLVEKFEHVQMVLRAQHEAAADG